MRAIHRIRKGLMVNNIKKLSKERLRLYLLPFVSALSVLMLVIGACGEPQSGTPSITPPVAPEEESANPGTVPPVAPEEENTNSSRLLKNPQARSGLSSGQRKALLA